MAHEVRWKILLTTPISIEFSNNFCSYMLWSLTTSKSGHQKGCPCVSTHLKSADEVKICNPLLLHQHFTARPCAFKNGQQKVFFCH